MGECPIRKPYQERIVSLAGQDNLRLAVFVTIDDTMRRFEVGTASAGRLSRFVYIIDLTASAYLSEPCSKSGVRSA